MCSQWNRPRRCGRNVPQHLAPAINATAENLPFDDDSFDASMASVTVHQWPDVQKGLGEMRRVTRGPVVVLTFDPVVPEPWWLPEYVPVLFDIEARRMPTLDTIADALGGARIEVVPIPVDSIDGFGQAFFGRPERVLDPAVRRAMSAWSFVAPEVIEEFEQRLAADLASGEWDRRWGRFRTMDEFDGGLRLVISEAPPSSHSFTGHRVRMLSSDGPCSFSARIIGECPPFGCPTGPSGCASSPRS